MRPALWRKVSDQLQILGNSDTTWSAGAACLPRPLRLLCFEGDNSLARPSLTRGDGRSEEPICASRHSLSQLWPGMEDSQVVPKCWSVSVTLQPRPWEHRVWCVGAESWHRWDARGSGGQWGPKIIRSVSLTPLCHNICEHLYTEQLGAVSGLQNCRAESNLRLHGQSRDHCLAWCKSPSLSWNQYSVGISCGVIGSLAIFGAFLRAPSSVSRGYIKISAFISKKPCTCGGKLDNVAEALCEDLNI